MNCTLKEVFHLAYRILLSILLIELFYRITCTSAIHAYHNQIASYFSFASIFFSFCYKGLLFSCKYIVYYGIPSLVNKMVGMKTTELPRCTALIHTNRELWRYFDTGIYEFIKNYLYVPMGGKKQTKLVQILSLMLSFMFISYWHGSHLNVTLWSLGNFLMVVCEIFCFSYFYNRETRVSNYLSPRFKRYLFCAIICSWQVLMYLCAFMFLSSIEACRSLYGKMLEDKHFYSLFFVNFFGVSFAISQIRMELFELRL